MPIPDIFRNAFRALQQRFNRLSSRPVRDPSQTNNSITVGTNAFRNRNNTRSLFSRRLTLSCFRRSEVPEDEEHDAHDLNIITYNINGKKDIKKVINSLEHEPDVIFLQETCIGENDKIAVAGWNAYYTRYSENDKGAAILVKNDENMKFQFYSVKVDTNGRYVILQCSLKGQDFTFVCVYNHKDDTSTLELLSPYLKKMTVGVLLVGGDFNTTLSENDRVKETAEGKMEFYKNKNPQHEKLRPFFEKFIKYLDLDVLPGQFTYEGINKKKEKFMSRLDYFLISRLETSLFKKCTVCDKKEKDHKPLLLQLNTKDSSGAVEWTEEMIAEAMKALTLRNAESINGVEIMAAIKTLEQNKVNRPDGAVKYDQVNRKKLDQLKHDLNEIVNAPSLPDDFNSAESRNGRFFFANDLYIILARILAQRLENWGKRLSTGKRRNSQTSVDSQSLQQQTQQLESVESSTEAEWPDLDFCIKKKLEGHPSLEIYKVLEKMLPHNEITGKKILRVGCPLTPILRELLKE